MNSLCEGGAKKGAAIFYAQVLFHYCAHKLYAPEHPAEPPGAPGGASAQAGVYPLPPLRGLPLPRQRLPLLGEGWKVPALRDAEV